MPLDADAPAADACRSGELVSCSNFEEVVRRYPYVEDVADFDDRALLTVPLRDADSVLGAAFWAFDDPHDFDGGALAFVDLVVEPVVAAIGRARARARSEETARQLLEREQELARSRARLAALVDANVLGIIEGEGAQITRANQTFLSMLGLPANAVEQGLDYPSLTPVEWQAQDAEVVAHMLSHGRAEPFEKEYLRTDGTRVPVLIGGATVSTDPFTWIVYVADLTVRRDAERQSAARQSASRSAVARAARDRPGARGELAAQPPSRRAGLRGGRPLLGRGRGCHRRWRLLRHRRGGGRTLRGVGW
jgi:PAS domain S-box-containing protein